MHQIISSIIGAGALAQTTGGNPTGMGGSNPPSPIPLPNPLNTTDLTVVISSITGWLITVTKSEIIRR